MPSSYSSDLAKASIIKLKRDTHITPLQLVQCISVCASQAEFLFLMVSFFDGIPQNAALTSAIQNIKNGIVNLDYKNAMDTLRDIFTQPDNYIEKNTQEEWSECITSVHPYLSGVKPFKKESVEPDAHSSRRVFESILAVRYLEAPETITDMQKLCPDKPISNMNSLVEFVTSIANEHNPKIWHYWRKHWIPLGEGQGRGIPKMPQDSPQVRSPGIFKSTTPRPMYMYDHDASFTTPSQSDKNRFLLLANNWQSNNPNVPLVASYSGHAVWYIGFLIESSRKIAQEERQHYVESMLKALVATYISQGFHSYQEVMTIVTHPPIFKSLEQIDVHLNPQNLFSGLFLEAVFSETTDYNTNILLKRAAHCQLTMDVVKKGKLSIESIVDAVKAGKIPSELAIKEFPLDKNIILASYEKNGFSEALLYADGELLLSLVENNQIIIEPDIKISDTNKEKIKGLLNASSNFTSSKSKQAEIKKNLMSLSIACLKSDASLINKTAIVLFRTAGKTRNFSWNKEYSTDTHSSTKLIELLKNPNNKPLLNALGIYSDKPKEIDSQIKEKMNHAFKHQHVVEAPTQVEDNRNSSELLHNQRS